MIHSFNHREMIVAGEWNQRFHFFDAPCSSFPRAQKVGLVALAQE